MRVVARLSSETLYYLDDGDIEGIMGVEVVSGQMLKTQMERACTPEGYLNKCINVGKGKGVKREQERTRDSKWIYVERPRETC